MTYSDIALLVKQAAIEEGVDDVLEEWAAEADPEELAEFLEAAAEELLEEESPLLAKSAQILDAHGRPIKSERTFVKRLKEFAKSRLGKATLIGVPIAAVGGGLLYSSYRKRRRR